MRRAYICIAIALMMVCIIPSQSIMQFTYECEGKNATATTYSYLKEPRVEETGFTRGLKSGSFNYLENGDINLREDISYDHGNGTNISNSTVNHALTVEFEGKRGISEFFARGFFGDDRWISAWKKIRYEMSPDMKVNGKPMVARPSNSINVDASAVMDTLAKNVSYSFTYDAKIKNGAIEGKDATGWTNRTGSKRTDWEYEFRTVGEEVNVTNNLVEIRKRKTAGGPGDDWLPCCISGTVPTIDQLNIKWPSEVMIRTLKADTQLPSAKLTSKQIVPAQLAPVALTSAQFGNIYAKPGLVIGSIGSISNTRVVAEGPQVQSGDLYYVKKTLRLGMVNEFPLQLMPSVNGTGNISYVNPPILEPQTCNSGGCDGYECINTYDEDYVGAPTGGEIVPLRRGQSRNIDVSAYVFEINNNTQVPFYGTNSEAAKEERYKITVSNNGDVPLSNVSATAEMAKGMKYGNSVIYFDSGTGTLAPSLDPKDFDEYIKTKATWIFGTLEPNETKTILMRTYQKMNVDNTDISVKVVGIASDDVLVKDSANRAETEICELRSLSGGPCFDIQKKLGLCKTRVCPRWTWSNLTI